MIEVQMRLVKHTENNVECIRQVGGLIVPENKLGQQPVINSAIQQLTEMMQMTQPGRFDGVDVTDRYLSHIKDTDIESVLDIGDRVYITLRKRDA